jgi:hypothetical protein
MTAPSAPSRMRRRGQQNPYELHQTDSAKARLALALACVWPLIVLFFLSSGSSHHPESGGGALPDAETDTSLKLRNFLDRVDILGYGPTHPRVAVVLVGNDSDKIIRSVESVFR